MGVTGAVASVSLDGFACAVIAGATRCWGKGAKLGSTDPEGFETYVPGKPAVGLETGSAQVSVGSAYACALTTDGAVKCWGEDITGNLGDGKDVNGGTASQDHPTAVVSLP
jgi:alpha-tubulin suppressor-like RCC1 family protein